MRRSRYQRSGCVVGLAVLALVAACQADGDSGDTATAVAGGGGEEGARVQRFLDSRYLRSDVRHVYRATSGQDIDCVDVMAQPALKIPALRGHTPLLRPPAYLPPLPQGQAPATFARPEDDGVDDLGRLRRCPEGSVPIISVTADSIRRRGGLDAFMLHSGMKGGPPQPATPTVPLPRLPTIGSGSGTTGATTDAPVVQPRPAAAPPVAPPSFPPNPGYNYAQGVQMYIPNQPCGVPGGGATLSVNWPSTLAWSTTWQSNGDHSISQIWLASPGAAQICTPPDCMQTVEMGWNVDPQMYEDNAPHFFIYSTKDGYRYTGCYNMEPTCSGFYGTMTGSGLVLVQNPPMIPGYALTVPQSEILVYTYHSPDHNWWLRVNDGWIGYIPGSLFDNGNGGGAPLGGTTPGQNYYATWFEAGGEVADSGMLPNGTTTDMGSGMWPSNGYPAAYQRNVVYTTDFCDPDASQEDLPAPINLYAPTPSLYTVDNTPPQGFFGWDTYFYFGGPGKAGAALAAPTGLAVQALDGSVVLTWDTVYGTETYQVHMGTTPGTPTSTEFFGIAENRLTVTGLQNGTRYYFNVRALNSDTGASPWSAQASGVPSPPAPPVPAGLTASGGFQQVTLNWGSAAGATSYTVKMATSATGTLGTSHSGLTSTSYTYTGLSNAKTYWFVVSAQNGAGSSADSARVTGLTVPAAPTGVSATASSGKVTVKWSSTSGATSYTVYRSLTAGSRGTAIKTGNTTTSFVDGSPTRGVKNYYIVVAVNGSGASPNSTQVNATP